MLFASFCFIELIFGPSSIIESTASLRNFLIEQYSDVHSGGSLDCRSAIGLSFAFPLICLVFIGVLFMFVNMLDILALAENLPLLIRFIASKTGLLSVSTINGLLFSLMIPNSFSIPAASPKLSVSHGHHLRHFSGIFMECIRTGTFFIVFYGIQNMAQTLF